MSDPSPWSREGSEAQPDVIVIPEPGAPLPQAPNPELPPPPLPARRRTGTWVVVAIAAFVVLVLAGGAIGVALSRANRGGGGPTGMPTLSAPETIGPLRKAPQVPDDVLTDLMRDAGAERPFAVIYQDEEGRFITVMGGTGDELRSGSNEARLDQFFFSVVPLGVDPAARVDVDPGPRGGLAQCGEASGSGWTGTACAWTTPGALVGFTFASADLKTATSRLPAMLNAIVSY
jgi:hypothetical protein